jgi:hypothetical protein
MSAQLFSYQVTLEEFVEQILMERKITSREHLVLRYTLLSEQRLNEQERTLIDRVLYGVRHGLLRIVE